MKKTVLAFFTVFGLLSTVILIGLTFNIQPVNASGFIYIRADGSVDPDTASIQRDGNIYTFTDNIYYDEIVVERDNIVVDGAGYTLQGSGFWDSKGISLSGRSNVTVKNVKIEMFNYGIYLYESSNNTISGNDVANNDIVGISLTSSSNYNSVSGNDITNCDYGIYVGESSGNTVSGCHITNSRYFGVVLEGSSNNSISKSRIMDNDNGIALTYSELEPHDSSNYNSISANHVANNEHFGISLSASSNNSIYHNNFVNNTVEVYIEDAINLWDDGYPSGGNYWGNYDGMDLYSGPYQNNTGSDGIGDVAYVIDEDNQDDYPLMTPITLLYQELLEKYNSLLANYTSLQSNYDDLLTEFSSLNSTYNDLISDYDQLDSSYTALQNSYDELQSEQEAIKNELGTIRNLVYVLTAATIIFMATTAYFAIIKPKKKP